jgi:hypothetical protein
MNTVTRKLIASLLTAFLIAICLSSISMAGAQTPTPTASPTAAPTPTSTLYYPPLSTNKLTVSVNYPGAGSISPSSGVHQYYYGTVVTAYVSTNLGYQFEGWYLNGVYMGKLTSISLNMIQDYSLIAVFSMRTAFLTINTNPFVGGTTVPSPGTYNCSYGATITVSEYPSSGYNFSGWYLGGIYQGAGSSITVPMTSDAQLNAFFNNGSNPSPTDTPAPTPIPTATPTPPPNAKIPFLSFYCSSSTTQSGFNVLVSGVLGYNNTGISNAGVAFSYSSNGGSTWHDLAYLITGDTGNFSCVWMPSASGYYMVKGTWAGDTVYTGTTQTVNFAVQPMVNQNVFSVVSNSTLSALTFNSQQNQLSFSVTGASGTFGYVQVCIPKSLMPDLAKLQVSIDGSTVQYADFPQSDSWLITIEYHHSSHTVIMTIGDPSPTPTATATATATSTATSTSTATGTSTTSATNTATSVPTQTPAAAEYPAIIMVGLVMLMVIPLIALQRKKQNKTTAK